MLEPENVFLKGKIFATMFFMISNVLFASLEEKYIGYLGKLNWLKG